MKYGRRVDKGLIRLSDIFFAYLYMTFACSFICLEPWRRALCEAWVWERRATGERNRFWFVIDAGRNLLRKIRWLGKVFQYVDERRRLCVIMTHRGQRNLMNHRRSTLCCHCGVINSCRCVDRSLTVHDEAWRDCSIHTLDPKMSERGCNHFQTPPPSLMERDSGNNNPKKCFTQQMLCVIDWVGVDKYSFFLLASVNFLRNGNLSLVTFSASLLVIHNISPMSGYRQFIDFRNSP